MSAKKPRGCNFAVWWDGDLLRELLTGATISLLAVRILATALASSLVRLFTLRYTNWLASAQVNWRTWPLLAM